MAKSKSSSKVAAGNATHPDDGTEKQGEVLDLRFLCQFPFIMNNGGDTSSKDAGMHWWHVTDPEYWGQGVAVGKSFVDRVAAILPQNPQKVEETLCTSLGHLLLEGGSNGIATGFLHQLAHYACKGMQMKGGEQ